MFKVCHIIVIGSFGFGLAVISRARDKSDHDSEIYVQASESNWWAAKQKGCEGFGGHLYQPRSLDIPQEVAAILDPGHFYWIGAMQYSSWNWTYDNTPLYVYTGYVKSRITRMDATEIDGLTAFLCHLRCGKTYTEFGLQGRFCSCLDGDYSRLKSRSTLRQEMRCPGNYEELCGDENGMSIYEIASFRMTPNPSGQCVYAEKRWFGNYNTYLYQDHDCSNKRSLAYTRTNMGEKLDRCFGDTCVNHGLRTWDESEEIHKLLKVTDDNEYNLTRAMSYNYYTYWVGLRRRHRQVWINGTDVNMRSEKSVGQTCLRLRKSTSGEISFSWSNCAIQLKAICEKVVPITPGPPTTTSHTSIPPDRTTIFSPVWLTSTTPVVENRTSAITYTGQVNAGTAVGIALSIIAVLLIVILTVFVLKRRQLLCFSARRTKPNAGDNGAMENKTYSLAVDADDHIYSIPDLLEDGPYNNGNDRSAGFSSVPVETPHVIKDPYMNWLAQSSGESYNVLPENQIGGLPYLHGYDHVCANSANKEVNNTQYPCQSGCHPEHNREMADDYDHATKNTVPRVLPDDDEYQNLDDICLDLTGDQHSDGSEHLATDVYDLAGRVDDRGVGEDVDGPDENGSNIVNRHPTGNQCTFSGEAVSGSTRCLDDTTGSVHSRTGVDLGTGGPAGYTPYYYNTIHAQDKENVSDPLYEQYDIRNDALTADA